MKTLFTNNEQLTPSTESNIQNQLEALSLEAISIANVIEVFKGILPDLNHKIKTTLEDLSAFVDTKTFLHKTKINGDIKLINSLNKDLHSKIKLVNYTENRELLISVPEGFKGNLTEYSKLLNELTLKIYPEANKLLTEYKFIISGFLTNKDEKISLKDYTTFFNQIKRQRENFTNDISEYFTNNSATSKAKLGSVIDKFSDIEVIIKNINAINTVRAGNTLFDVSETTKDIVTILDTIIERVSKGDINNVSGQSAMNLSEGAYEIGKYIEFISIFNYKLEQATSTVTKLLEQLNEEIR